MIVLFKAAAAHTVSNGTHHMTGRGMEVWGRVSRAR